MDKLEWKSPIIGLYVLLRRRVCRQGEQDNEKSDFFLQKYKISFA